MSNQNRRKYTDEFKREAVKLVEEQRRTATEVARNLGVHRSRIERWCKRFGSAGAGTGEQAMNEVEREELKRLRAEVKQLRMERDILKKATAFFAREAN